MRLKLAGMALLLAGLAQTSFGSIITQGSFSIAGTVYVTDASGVTIPGVGSCPAGTACVIWVDPAGTTVSKVDIGTTGLPNGNIPLSIAGNDAGNISTLTNPPEVVGTFAAQPFFSFNNGGVTTVLNINDIVQGIDPTSCNLNPATATVGETCTPGVSFINFVNNPPPDTPGQNCTVGGQLECSATATWVFRGTTSDSNSTWSGNFTSQFNEGQPFETVLGTLAAQHFVSNTFSATITLTPTPTVPEPSTWEFMLGTAFIGLGVGLRYRMRRVVRS